MHGAVTERGLLCACTVLAYPCLNMEPAGPVALDSNAAEALTTSLFVFATLLQFAVCSSLHEIASHHDGNGGVAGGPW
jgi:hypothetical protein